MKIKIVLMAVFCIILSVAAVSAQDKTTNFAGNWELDTSKSKLSDRVRIESMTMNIAQTEKDLTVETKTTRAENEMRGNGGNRRRGGGGGGMMGGDATLTYTLDGKETLAESSAAIGETKLKAKFEKDGKLKLVQTRTIETQMGGISIKINENWELKDDGKTLIIKRDMETPRGTQSSEMYFTKQ